MSSENTPQPDKAPEAVPTGDATAETAVGVKHALMWGLGCAAAAVALGFAGAHAPARVRLIGLFPIALGVLLGVVISHLSLHFRRGLAAAVYAGAALAGITMIILFGESYRVYAAEVREAYSADPAAMLRLSAASQADDPESAETAAQVQKLIDENAAAREEALNELASVSRYLQVRLRGLGELEEPVPVCVALIEATLGLIACCVMIRVCILKHTV